MADMRGGALSAASKIDFTGGCWMNQSNQHRHLMCAGPWAGRFTKSAGKEAGA